MGALRIGLVYDLLGTYPRRPGDPPDVDAEYEPEETVRVLEGAMRRLGHEPVRLGSPHALLARIGKGELPALDAAMTIAEGFGGRNREAWAPLLLEMAGVPCLGSDALSLSTTLDKALASERVAAAGVAVPERLVLASVEELETAVLPAPFPLFVKPRWEGTAKGIGPGSRVEDAKALAREVTRILASYEQPALVERFVAGPEYTVTVVGNDPPRVLGVLQRALEERTRIGFHALERHPAPPGGWRHDLPGALDPALERELGRLALRAYEALECRDWARADFRLDADGTPRFLEMNPLPTFAREGSFGILAELGGRPLEDLLAALIAAALHRLGLPPHLHPSLPDEARGNGPAPHLHPRVPDEILRKRSAQRAAAELAREDLAGRDPQAREARAQRAAGERSKSGESGAPSRQDLAISPLDWRDWTWHMRNRIRDVESLARWIDPTPEEREAIARLADRFHFVITPYYASLLDPSDPECPLRRQVVPRLAELSDPDGLADPLHEVAHSPVKNVIRVYPDRIAFCVNNDCALYCRFCLRKRMVGDQEWAMRKRELAAALAWIRATPEIRDVLLTGGDPLFFSDDRLEWLLAELRAIPHVQIVRLGTRLPVTLPFRVTPALVRMLERYHPIWLNTHFNHPRELTPEAEEACARLAGAGIPLGNQSVLLRGVNDDVDTMQALCEGLVRLRVRPYYCYQAQLLEGTAHFRVPIERGVEIFRALRGRTSGFAIPQYVLDTPLGKVPISHPHWLGRDGDDALLETWDGRVWRERNPL
jgi:lysine 2,3-aminomutase